MMVKTANMLDEVTAAYDDYRFHYVYRSAYDFVNDLSNVYMDVAKDRLYSEAPSSKRRRAVQTVIQNILDVMVRVLAPILTFTTEEVWQHYPEAERNNPHRHESVQLACWPTREGFKPQLPADTEGLNGNWASIMDVRDVVTKALEEARAAGTIKKSQEAAVKVVLPTELLSVVDTYDLAVYQELFIVGAVSFEECAELSASVSLASGEKCPRCWNITELGGNSSHPDVCERCAAALEEIAFTEE